MILSPERIAELRAWAAFPPTITAPDYPDPPTDDELLGLLETYERAERYESAISYDEIGFAISALNGMSLPLNMNLTRDRVVRGLIRLHDALADAPQGRDGGER